jgi:hypothetical protein
MTTKEAADLLKKLTQEITYTDGSAKTDRFPSLRHVDGKVREVKMVLKALGPKGVELLDQLESDEDFGIQSRRVRLEALGNYCRTALRFLDTGVLGQQQKKRLYRAPDIGKLTIVMPALTEVIQERWLEAQKCQHAGAYFAAVVMMGSILEALLLARASTSPALAFQANAAPKTKDGKSIPQHDWTLSSLIDVAAELGWLKGDRKNFSHALRDSRNVVHPWHQVRTNAAYDKATCSLCWHVLNAAVDDLLASA